MVTTEKVSLRAAPETTRELFTLLEPDISCEFKSGLAVSSVFHAHDGYEILLFQEGEANFYIGYSCYHLTGGELVLISPGEYHRITLLDTATYKRVVVNTMPGIVARLSDDKTDLEQCFTATQNGGPRILQLSKQMLQKYTYTVKQLCTTLDGAGAFGYDLLVRAAATQFFVQLNSIFLEAEYDCLSVDVSGLMQAIVDYIDAHLVEGVCLEEMGRALAFNSIYMNRYFKSITGLTIGQYVLSKKINLAKRYLAEDRSVAEVCGLAGFNDCANFSRTFAKRVGCSPREFQKTAMKFKNRRIVL